MPPAGSAGGWPPGPDYGPSGYQPAPSWAAAPATPRRSILTELTGAPPQMIASGAISVGVVVLFVANLLIALGLPTGTAGNVRLSQFLSPADVAVAAILVVAVALVALVPVPEAVNVRMLAGFVAAAVAVAGLFRAIVVLTIAQEHAAVKLGNMFDALAAVLVAVAAAFWALKPRLLK